ncbi:RecB family exonuclease [Actinospongicola halichondriae]|uniref:RecB family exonuclease n=1 Tax=Actinospongicola halichondriae TaxID=3236844 RepID=UPI003D3730AE
MPLPVPSALSPSKLSSFTTCALQFRFANIDRIPEPPTQATSRGTLVHAALEHLFTLPPEERVPAIADHCVDVAFAAYRDDPEWTDLGLDDETEAAMVAEARRLVANEFLLEDPATVTTMGIELKLEVDIGGLKLRGIIDRLDLVDGELVVTDYKTGRSPSDISARSRMQGVHVYSLMCERFFGRRPVRVQLLHLAEPVAVIAEPTEQSTRALERRLQAVWSAVESACEHEDFRPRPSALCDWCSFQQWCPSFGGDPARAAVDVEIGQRADAGQEPLLHV